MNISIRTIKASDNPHISAIIKNTLAEFGANKPGTVFFDPATDALFETFRQPGAVYFIVELNNEIVGGAGIYPTDGLATDTCELVKMYLIRQARGMGLGKILIEKCLQVAREAGYHKVYLETMPELKQALSLYEKFGFNYLEGPVGNSGHTGCSLWMMKNLE